MDSTPLISVITPTKNDSNALAMAIRSIDSQNWPCIEHIVIDGSDNAYDSESCRGNVCRKSYALPPHGVYDAINEGIRRSTGDIIGVLNGNDRLASPGVLQSIADCFTGDNPADYVYGPVYYTDSHGKVVRRYHTQGYKVEYLQMGFAPPHPSLYMSREARDRIGNYDCSYPTAADFDMFVRLLNDSSLHGRNLGIYIAEMSCGGLSGKWRNRLYTNPHDKLRSLRSQGLPASPLRLLYRYLRIINEYLQ